MLRRVIRLQLGIDWRRVAPVAACVVLAAALPVYLPLLLGRVIDASLGGAGLTDLMPMLILIVLIAVLSAVAAPAASLFRARVGYGLSWGLARRLYGHLLRMPMLSYTTINPGVLNSRLTNDMRLIDPLFATVPIALLHGWVGLIAVAIALATNNPWFLLAFGLVPLALFAVGFAERRINETIRDAYEINAAAAAQIETTTNGDAVSLVRQAGAKGSVLDAIGLLSAHKAVLVVAHRLTSLERADRVIMIDDGRVVECACRPDPPPRPLFRPAWRLTSSL